MCDRYGNNNVSNPIPFDQALYHAISIVGKGLKEFETKKLVWAFSREITDLKLWQMSNDSTSISHELRVFQIKAANIGHKNIQALRFHNCKK